MIRKKEILILLIPLILLNGIVTIEKLSEPVSAWGLITHQQLVKEAAKEVPAEWQDAFKYYLPELVSGSTYPDQVLQDWENHLYYPITGEYNAPWHINNTINGIWSNVTAEEDWETIFLLLGILSHYIADINIPVHTDAFWDGHIAYEKDINNHLDNLSYSVFDFGTITDPVDFAISCATYAHQYYWDVRNAYPIGNETDIISSNTTIKTLTEEQLGRAMGAIVAIWEYTLKDLTPPDVEVVEDVAKALVDNYHDNDYADTSLTSFVDTLNRDVVEVFYNEDEITAATLADIDLLIITAPYGNNFTDDEISAISSWYAAGGHLLISSRGDYSDVNHVTINNLLEAIGSDLRVNDDNVYTTQADPDFYKPWYCKTDEFNNDDPIAKQIVGNLTQKIQFFSPSSIYAESDSEFVHWLIFGEETFYQSDENPPAPEVIYDNTDDNVGGSAIPLAAVELAGESSLALFGSTTWSNYDFGLTDKDNKDLIWFTIEFLLNIDLLVNNNATDDSTPTNGNGEETETTPFSSLAFISMSISFFVIIVRIRKNKLKI
ncbi:MAG: zinc dependent phospholipase C family protein [Candidatus Heimdallarchaeaceae archaeon]